MEMVLFETKYANSVLFTDFYILITLITVLERESAMLNYVQCIC